MPTPRAVRRVTPYRTPQLRRPIVTPRAPRPVAVARTRGPADLLRAGGRLLGVIALGAAVGGGLGALGRPDGPPAAEPAPLGGAASMAAIAALPVPDEAPPALLFAELDTTLAVAIEQGQLAALQANDVALRAFAVQQVGRYEELRAELRGLARRLGVDRARTSFAAVPEDSLQALRLVRGARFDRAYVRQALDVHEALLTDLDAALRIVENAEVRQALEELRGAMDADQPAEGRPR